MMALDTIALKQPKGVHGMLSKILGVADNSGSVIARDHAVESWPSWPPSNFTSAIVWRF
jgi:hypothetical protein